MKIGDRVKIKTSSRWYRADDSDDGNPTCEGTISNVYETSGDYGISVDWDNGKRNGYGPFI